MRCPACKDLFDLRDVKYCPTCGAALFVLGQDLLLGQTVGGRYKINSLIAEGGMGRVYLAEQVLGGVSRKIAIKVLLSDISARDQDSKRFERECRTVAELEHPNTIKFFDFGQTDDGDLFIAMEFLSGQSLAQILKNGPLFPERVDLILGQICGSLQEAHDRGIIHRDLKPDNIIITSPGGAPDFVKVLDFGIAKRTGGRDPKLTPLGVVLGSPPYMSPEQFTMQDIDAKSDIYSLGVVAYQLLTGQLPFNANDPIEWAALHMGVQPTPIESHGVSIPKTMAAAIHRALSKDLHARPASMRDFYSQLTIGVGSLLPGRASSMMPLSPSQIPLPPRANSRSSVGPDSDDVGTRVREPSEDEEGPPTEVKVPRSAETIEAPGLYAEASSSYAPGLGPAQPELPVFSSANGMASAPQISFHEVSQPDLSAFHSESQPGSASSSTRAVRSGKGTLVMAASEPPPPRGRLTMPDLMPPTVRDPTAIMKEVRGSRSILWVALGLILLGALASAGLWLFWLRPAAKSEQKRKAPPSASAAASMPTSAPLPGAPVNLPARGSAPILAPPSASSAMPASSAPKAASPCQTAIFRAVSGDCVLAQRAFARCESNSPFRASATRAVSGLCAEAR